MPTTTHSKIAAAALALAVLAQPVAAMAAKKVCVFDPANSNAYIFSKLKLPKKPGDTTTVQAASKFTINPNDNNRPCSGAITRLSNGNMRVGLTCHGDNSLGWHVGWTTTDATLVGTAHFEYDGDRGYNDVSVNLSTYDCSLVP